jgi:hypothetical protein
LENCSRWVGETPNRLVKWGSVGWVRGEGFVWGVVELPIICDLWVVAVWQTPAGGGVVSGMSHRAG